jgi:hypothetical protein
VLDCDIVFFFTDGSDKEMFCCRPMKSLYEYKYCLYESIGGYLSLNNGVPSFGLDQGYFMVGSLGNFL